MFFPLFYFYKKTTMRPIVVIDHLSHILYKELELTRMLICNMSFNAPKTQLWTLFFPLFYFYKTTTMRPICCYWSPKPPMRFQILCYDTASVSLCLFTSLYLWEDLEELQGWNSTNCNVGLKLCLESSDVSFRIV